MPKDAYSDFPNRIDIMSGEAKLSREEAMRVMDETYFYPPNRHAYVTSICGKACDMACYIHLEEKGMLTKSFNEKYRRRPEWKLSI